MLSLTQIAQTLGGEVVPSPKGDYVRAPGKGHSATDRSLSIKLTDKGDDIVVNSFCGDDPIEAKDWIRDKLGLPKWQPKKKANGSSGAAWIVISEHVYRTA